MALDNKYVTQEYLVECKGRDGKGNEVLNESVRVEVEIYKRPASNTISSDVRCQYNRGEHGEYCNASGTKAICPYAFDLPYALEQKNK